MITKIKFIDFTIQLILILCLVLAAFWWDSSYPLYAYFFIGGWQILSCIVHYLIRHRTPSFYGRRYYVKILLLVFLTAVFLLLLGFLGISFYFMWAVFVFVIATPALAIWYCIITWKEYTIADRRSIIHLK
jgi:phosphatidylglycerophosphate synthase